MNRRTLSRYALSIGAAALLAACGGSQPPIGAPGAMESRATTALAERRGSWMLPEAKSEKLVYIAAGAVYVYAYGSNKLVGTLSRIGDTVYICSDKHGNVFVPVTDGTSQTGVYEYAHGGTTPINYLDIPGALACSVDFSTGDLAVINGGPSVYVFQDASGPPQMYMISNLYSTDVAYDNSGNLFIDGFSELSGFLLEEVPANSKTIQNVTIDGSEGGNGENPIFWDGHYLGLGSYQSAKNRRHSSQEVIQRLAISGTTASIAGYTPLGLQKEPYHIQFWIRAGVAVQPSNKPRNSWLIQYFRYPRGKVMKTIKVQNLGAPFGVTVSIAP